MGCVSVSGESSPSDVASFFSFSSGMTGSNGIDPEPSGAVKVAVEDGVEDGEAVDETLCSNGVEGVEGGGTRIAETLGSLLISRLDTPKRRGPGEASLRE